MCCTFKPTIFNIIYTGDCWRGEYIHWRNSSKSSTCWRLSIPFAQGYVFILSLTFRLYALDPIHVLFVVGGPCVHLMLYYPLFSLSVKSNFPPEGCQILTQLAADSVVLKSLFAPFQRPEPIHHFLFLNLNSICGRQLHKEQSAPWTYTGPILSADKNRFKYCQLESCSNCPPNISINKSFWCSWRLNNNYNRVLLISLRVLLLRSAGLICLDLFERQVGFLSTISLNNYLECTL